MSADQRTVPGTGRTGPGTDPATDPACDVAHGHGAGGEDRRAAGTLVAVFAGAVSDQLLALAAHLDQRTVLVEPDPSRRGDRAPTGAVVVAALADAGLDRDCDVVLTDHHRDELGEVLRDALAAETRWIGVMGNPRHTGPHVAALQALGVDAADIERVHRPIGLNIGSRTPPEIALATMAGLVADRNGRPGGFDFGG